MIWTNLHGITGIGTPVLPQLLTRADPWERTQPSFFWFHKNITVSNSHQVYLLSLLHIQYITALQWQGTISEMQVMSHG